MNLETRKKLQVKKTMLHLSILSFVVVVIWIGFEIYHSYNKPADLPGSQLNLQPIQPNLYTDLAQRLTERISISDDELQRFAGEIRSSRRLTFPLASPNTPIVTFTGVASDSGQLTN